MVKKEDVKLLIQTWHDCMLGNLKKSTDYLSQSVDIVRVRETQSISKNTFLLLYASNKKLKNET